jgi:hypothetical protein
MGPGIAPEARRVGHRWRPRLPLRRRVSRSVIAPRGCRGRGVVELGRESPGPVGDGDETVFGIRCLVFGVRTGLSEYLKSAREVNYNTQETVVRWPPASHPDSAVSTGRLGETERTGGKRRPGVGPQWARAASPVHHLQHHRRRSAASGLARALRQRPLRGVAHDRPARYRSGAACWVKTKRKRENRKPAPAGPLAFPLPLRLYPRK